MTDKEMLRFVFAKLCAVADKITEGVMHKDYGNAAEEETA